MKRSIQRAAVGLTTALLLSITAASSAAQCTDDYLENNDTCNQSTLVFGGFSASLTSLYQDDDYFQIHVGNGEDLTVDIFFPHSLGDLDLYLYDIGCASLLASSTSTTDNESLTYNNASGTGQDLIVRVTMYAPNPDILCNDYDISFTVSTTIACTDDDETGHHDNDNCGDANLIFPEAVYLNLGVLDTDPDYYTLAVPAWNTLFVDLTFLHSLGDIEVVLYDATCSNQLAWGTSATDDESIMWTNATGAPMDVKWNVYLLNSTCNQYHMIASLEVPDCGPDDGFEDNDVCLQAAPLGDGFFPGLVVSSSDPDFFIYGVSQGETTVVDALFTHSQGDVDIRLWDACGGNLLAAGTSTDDDEHITWSNPSGPDIEVILEVLYYTPGGGTPGCNIYDLVIDITATEPGSNYCSSLPNSTGSPALISAQGSASIAANDLVLIAVDLPPNQNGLFYYGPNQIQIPFGNGIRCVGGGVHRLPVLNSGALGELIFAMDYTTLPPAGAIFPGSLWNFQAWYRDPPAGGATFNLSDAYAILFLP